MLLSSAQKKHFKGLAHKLNPFVIIGNQGLTEAVHNEIEQVLNDHELIKIRINAETRGERRGMAAVICKHHDATLLQTIGHIIVIYRPSPNK